MDGWLDIFKSLLQAFDLFFVRTIQYTGLLREEQP
jgi:hypothetical protein